MEGTACKQISKQFICQDGFSSGDCRTFFLLQISDPHFLVMRFFAAFFVCICCPFFRNFFIWTIFSSTLIFLHAIFQNMHRRKSWSDGKMHRRKNGIAKIECKIVSTKKCARKYSRTKNAGQKNKMKNAHDKIQTKNDW